MLRDPFVLTPEFDGPKQPLRQQAPVRSRPQIWTAPFVMANMTRNVHRSNMLLGFPYSKDFVYDEMVVTGPGDEGEATAKKVMAANNKLSGADIEAGWGRSKEVARGRPLRFAVHGDRARRQPGPRRRQGRPRSRLWLDVKDDPRNARSACCVTRRRSPAGIWTPGAAMGHKLIKRLVDHAGLTFEVEK